jgi:hypothetical protein
MAIGPFYFGANIAAVTANLLTSATFVRAMR